MKSIYLILLNFLLLSCATIMVSVKKTGDIIEVTGSKNELYLKSNEWMVRNFNNAKSVIQFSDKEAGKIMGKYRMNSEPELFSLISLIVKDNTVKIEIEPIGIWAFPSVGGYGPEKQKEIYEDYCKKEISKLIESYRKYIFSNEDIWVKPGIK